MKEDHNPLKQRKNQLGAACQLICVLVVALSLPLAARAQDTGYISGTVTDKSGAAVAGADVVVTSVSGGLTRATTTNTDGAYVLAALPGGTYNLSVTAKGFQKYIVQNVVLEVAEKARIDVQLTVGAVNEEIVVTGESVAQVETTSSDLSGTVTGKQIDQLVLNGRNFTQLVGVVPGVVSQTGQDEGTVGVYGSIAYSINGGRTEYNNWELDGGDNMDNGSNATLNVYPNVEAIAEFKVLASNYGAQYGRNGSGTIEVETKSGGSSFHGSAFEYLRNDMFNARPWESGDDPAHPNPNYKKHDFGYTIGGPVYIPNHYNSDKKKTFFFFSEEWRRERNPSSILQNVPSDAERGVNTPGFGDFSVLCSHQPSDCPNVPDPSKVPIDPVASALLNLIPKANTTKGLFDDGTPIPAVSQIISTPTTWREELVRIDHNITDNYRLTFRYIHDAWQTEVPNPLWGVGASNFQDIRTKFVGPGTSFVTRLTANITPTLLNEFVASYTGDHIFLTAVGPSAETTLPSGFAMGSIFNNGFGGKLPSISLGSNTAYGGGDGLAQDTGYFPWNNANPTYTYRDNLTKILGTHTLTVGAYFVFAQKNEQATSNLQGILTFDSSNTNIPSTGNALADMYLGRISQYQQWNIEPKYYNRYRIVEPYFQDDWRVTKRFTLNLGLRLSLFGTYRERFRHAFNFYPNGVSNGYDPANAPTVDDADGTLTGFAGALVPAAQGGNPTGNPFNGIVQCGGPGGTFPVPGFPNARAASNSNAGCLSGHLFNPAPRFGFAFDPRGDGKMAIRGGYGIFFEHTNGNEGNTESLEGSAPFALSTAQFNISGYANIGGSGAVTPFFPLSVNSIPSKAIWPYVQQWHLDVQKELPFHFVASISYVGSKGTHLNQQRDLNQIVPLAASNNPYVAAGMPITPEIDDASGNVIYGGDCSTHTVGPGGAAITGAALDRLNVACGGDPNTLRPFRGYGSIVRLEDLASSTYHALQASARRTVGDFTLSLAYTYGHSIDNSSDRFDSGIVNSLDTTANRASSNFDQRHNLAISYVYALPFFKGSGLQDRILGGWQISGITVAQTGTPFNVTNGTDFSDSAGVAGTLTFGTATGSRPDLVGNPHTGKTEVAGVFGPLFFNPDAYATPIGLTFGNVGRNTLYAPGRLNFDFGLFKRFKFGETKAVDFRWENYNLFNHTQFTGIDGALGSSTFLHATGAHAPRRMQFGLRFQF